MCTIENSNDLCKGRLEAVSGVMDPVAESCGRDARVWGHTKKSDVPHTPGAEGRGRAQHPHVAPCPARFGGLRAQPCWLPPSQCASAPSRQRRCPASRGSRGRWKRPFDFPILAACAGVDQRHEPLHQRQGADREIALHGSLSLPDRQWFPDNSRTEP